MSKKIITIKDVEHIAQLSRINFNSEEEKESMVSDLDSVVSYFEILSKIDTSKVAPFSKPLGNLREDCVQESFRNEDIIKNAPHKNDTAFVVPRVVD